MLKQFSLLAAGLLLVGTCSAKTLPVGPITFGSNADYDASFKEFSLNGILRSTSGYLEVSGVPTATAAFDTSATGGTNGSGGTGGSDANNDLADFTISADVASSVAGGIGAGFLLRLNNSEAGGYLAAIHTQGTTSVTFDIGEGASLTSAGANIFSRTISLSGLSVAASTFYHYKVTILGGTFAFDFGSGAATATFTDTTITATVGQVGILMDTLSPSSATRMDNFSIVPEPEVSSFVFVALFAFAVNQLRRKLFLALIAKRLLLMLHKSDSFHSLT